MAKRISTEIRATFLAAITEGASVLEASEKAGISRPTGYRILKQIRREEDAELELEQPVDVPYVPGETAALRCGSPLMVVVYVGADDMIHLTWHDANDQVQRAQLPKAAIVKLSLEEYPDSPYNPRRILALEGEVEDGRYEYTVTQEQNDG